MKKLLFPILSFLLITSQVFAAPPSRQNTYVSGTEILASDVTQNEDAIFNYLSAGVDTYADGTIVNADINATANIQSDKLNLGSIAQSVSITSSGSFSNAGTSTFTGNSTFAGTTIADLGTVTTADINAGSFDNLTSLTAANALDIGAFNFRALTLQSDATTGTAPLTVASTTKVTNLNADLLDGANTSTTASNGAIPLMGANGYMPDASVDTTALKTTTGEVSTTGTAGTELTLPGGEYGFYPQIKMGSTATAEWGATIGGPGLTGTYDYAGNTSYTSTIIMMADGVTTISAQQRYVTASGQDFWVFLKVKKGTGEIISTYSAPDHPAYGNGGDFEALPHPFGNVGPDEEVIVLSKEDALTLRDRKVNSREHVADILHNEFKVDMAREKSWTPIHSGRFLGEAPELIDRVPAGVKVRGLVAK